jgi:hypothetical protein
MELRKDHFTVAFDAWAAARDGNGIVIRDEYYPEAHELAEAGWLRRGFEPDGEMSWHWTGAADTALGLAALTDVSGREN